MIHSATTNMRAGLLIGCWWVALRLVAQTAAIPAETVQTTQLLMGEWRFVHVLGPDGQPTDHVDRGTGPNGETRRVNANGPDMTLRADGTYEKRFTPEHKDTGYWRATRPNEVAYTMLVPMHSKQGQMLGFAGQMLNKPTLTDGQGNYLDTSTDHLIGLTATEMRVLEEGGYTYVYRRQ